jgi:hypothetical protein
LRYESIYFLLSRLFILQDMENFPALGLGTKLAQGQGQSQGRRSKESSVAASGEKNTALSHISNLSDSLSALNLLGKSQHGTSAMPPVAPEEETEGSAVEEAAIPTAKKGKKTKIVLMSNVRCAR